MSFLDNLVVADGRSKKRKRDKEIDELWSIWCQETGRQDDIVDSVRESFDHWLQEGYSFSDLAYIVAAAARLRPVKSDPDDVKRLIRALEDEDLEYQASQAYECGREPFLYAPFRAKLLIMRDELADLLDDDESLWTSDDEESAMWIMTKMSHDDVQALRDDMESAGVWEVPMPPSLFHSYKRKRKWRENINSATTGSSASTSSYTQGAQEASSLEDVDFSVDPAANKLFVRTKSVRRVVEFHNQAPAGYWDDAGQLMDDEDISAEDAYALLEDDYDWHPEDRKKG